MHSLSLGEASCNLYIFCFHPAEWQNGKIQIARAAERIAYIRMRCLRQVAVVPIYLKGTKSEDTGCDCSSLV